MIDNSEDNINRQNKGEIKELIKKLDDKLKASKINLNLPNDDLDDFDWQDSDTNFKINEKKGNYKLNINENKEIDDINNNLYILNENNHDLNLKLKSGNLNEQQINDTNDKGNIRFQNEENNNSNNLYIDNINKKNDNKNEENNYKDNENEEEFDFDVNEIVNVQKEEMEKKRIEDKKQKEKEEEEKRRLEEEEMRREKEDKEREREEEERREKEDEERKKLEIERKKIEEEEKRIEEEKERKKIEDEEKKRFEEEKKEEEKEKKEKKEEEKKENKENNNSIGKQNDEYENEKTENRSLHESSIYIQSEETNKKQNKLENKIFNETNKNDLQNANNNEKNISHNNSTNIQIIPEKLKNLKIFQILSEFQKKNILSILDDIKEFKSKGTNINNLNIDDYPTIKLNLNQKEKTLDNIITNFKNKIKKDENETEKRKHDFISHIYFENTIKTSPLLELIPECNISHIDLLKKIYNEQGLKNIPEINDDYEKIIFPSENKLILDYYSPIGKIEDLKSFIYKYNFEENPKILVNSLRIFNYWRNIQGDGNSFYRAFMFGLIEFYILNNSLNILKEIISEISSENLINVYIENNIDYKIPFIILGAIIKLLTEDKRERAYELFIKSYLLENGSFDKMLIIYLRYISYIYVDEVIKLSEQNQGQSEEEKTISKNINKELIITMNIEPNFFIICLMSYLFDVNLNVFWIDRDLLQCKDGTINFIDEDNTDEIPLISLGYFFSSYHRIYSVNSMNDRINELFNSNLCNLKKLTYQIKIKEKCEICKNETFVIFLEQNFKVCKNCLEKYIYNISFLRNDSLNKDNYIGQEYYSRPFNLKDKYILNDYEFIEIKEEKNIINYLQYTASIVCSNCKKNFDKKNLNNLKCKCLLCDKCLEEIILNITKEKKILNSYEKKDLGAIKCISCQGDFSYEDAIEHFKDIKDQDRKNAINRMNKYVNTLCLVCGVQVRKNEDNNFSDINNNEERNEENNNKRKEKYIEIKKYKKVRVRKENDKGKGIDYSDDEHVVCIDCYEKNKIRNLLNSNISISKENDKKNEEKSENESDSSEDDNKNIKNKYYIDIEEGECFCIICNKKHFLIDKNIKNGGCCTSGCIIN